LESSPKFLFRRRGEIHAADPDAAGRVGFQSSAALRVHQHGPPHALPSRPGASGQSFHRFPGGPDGDPALCKKPQGSPSALSEIADGYRAKIGEGPPVDGARSQGLNGKTNGFGPPAGMGYGPPEEGCRQMFEILLGSQAFGAREMSPKSLGMHPDTVQTSLHRPKN
jgi:hypothetical protein